MRAVASERMKRNPSISRSGADEDEDEASAESSVFSRSSRSVEARPKRMDGARVARWGRMRAW